MRVGLVQYFFVLPMFGLGNRSLSKELAAKHIEYIRQKGVNVHCDFFVYDI